LAISYDPTRIREYPEDTQEMLENLVRLQKEGILPPTHINLTFTSSDKKGDLDPVLDFCNRHQFKVHLAPCKYQDPPAYLLWKEMYQYVALKLGTQNIITRKELIKNCDNLPGFASYSCLQGIQYYIDTQGRMMYPCDEYASQLVGNVLDAELPILFEEGHTKFGTYPISGSNCAKCESECHTTNSLLCFESFSHASFLMLQLLRSKLFPRSKHPNSSVIHSNENV
jgi:hypothetical protein